MDRGQLGMFGLIYLYSPRLNILFQKIKDTQNSKFLVCFWKPCPQPEPGCKVRVASFGIEDGARFQPAGVLQDTLDLYLHVCIVS